MSEPTAPSSPILKPDAVSAEAKVALSGRGLEKSYRVGREDLHVLKGVDVDVREGEILAVLGQSGSGKSTLLHVLGWIDRADKGEILYDGLDRASLSPAERATLRNRHIGFVFQFYHLMPELTALENVLLPSMILYRGAAWRRARDEVTARAEGLLARVGLSARSSHRPNQLSGGERQRVAIARALQNRPSFLFCDEPTGNLDGKTAADIRRLLWDLNRVDRQTMVIVTHDPALAAEAHRAVHLVDGRVAEGPGNVAEVLGPAGESG